MARYAQIVGWGCYVPERVLTNRDLELSLIHISEPTRLLSISYAVFCLKKKKQPKKNGIDHSTSDTK